MLAAVFVSRRVSRRTGLLQTLLKESEMFQSAVGCMAFGVGGAIIIGLLGVAKLNSAFAQLDQLIPLGIIIAVIYEIRRSNGTRSLNFPASLGIAYCFYFGGVLVFSKQGMLLPLYCWLLPVCALRYRLSALQILSILAAVFVIFQYLVPYAQYGRSFIEEGQTTRQTMEISTRLLEHPEQTRQQYKEVVTGRNAYFNEEQGFWDRLNFIATDDGLVNFTDQGHVFGLLPVEAAFLNAVPHFIWPDKPGVNFGNQYAREMGGLSEENTSTGISFSPTAEAYHMDRWVGLFVVAPLVWFLLFVTFDSLFGDLRATPWGLLALALLSHTAPEGAITGAIYLLIFGTEILCFSALFATWIAPVFASAVLPGPPRKTLRGGEVRLALASSDDIAGTGSPR
jgi:hypothetical protein